ncbi:MAG: hypothetical protein A4E48_00605 [Methanosaeta sp. PtaU1.Bin060]|jgi:hypothetical protein|nr:MAG: hypothetical protein A4E48_00605 [Methanosaeta sp. PtaU1.Bin060]
MDLMSRMQEFMASQLERLSGELAMKYDVPAEEFSDDVDAFLRETYGPAVEAATAICQRERPVVLFIGREDCAVCQRCEPVLARFLQDHEELDLVKLDYAKPEGLLYHMIQHDAKGMLPMIAIIFRGGIRKLFTGECSSPEVYERHYRDLPSEGCQNIYAL